MFFKKYKYLLWSVVCLAGLVISIFSIVNRLHTGENFGAFVKGIASFFFLVGLIYYLYKFWGKNNTISNEK